MHKVPRKPCIGGVARKLPTNSAFTPLAGLEEGIWTAQSHGTNPAGSESEVTAAETDELRSRLNCTK